MRPVRVFVGRCRFWAISGTSGRFKRARRCASSLVQVAIDRRAARSWRCATCPIREADSSPSRRRQRVLPGRSCRMDFGVRGSIRFAFACGIPNREGRPWEPHYPWGGGTTLPTRNCNITLIPGPGRICNRLPHFHPFSIEQGTLHIRARPAFAEQQKETGFTVRIRPPDDRADFLIHLRLRGNEGPGSRAAAVYGARSGSHRSTNPGHRKSTSSKRSGHDTRSYIMTAHRSFLGFHSQSQFRAQTPDLAEDFHVYAVKWTAEEIVWYFDGVQVAPCRRQATPTNRCT